MTVFAALIAFVGKKKQVRTWGVSIFCFTPKESQDGVILAGSRNCACTAVSEELPDGRCALPATIEHYGSPIRETERSLAIAGGALGVPAV